VKQSHTSISSDDSNIRRRPSRRSSSNVTQNNVIATTTTTTSTCLSRQTSPRDSRVSLTQQPSVSSHRPSLLIGHRRVVPSASLNSAFWSSTSSDRRSTTSSLQSVSTFRGGGITLFGKTAISRTSSAGPPAGLTMRGIQEEDAEFWQLLQHQQTSGDDDDRGAVGIGGRVRYRSPGRLQDGIKASFSYSCPCLSLAAVGLQTVRPERESVETEQLSPAADDDNSKHRRRSLADKDHHRVSQWHHLRNCVQ